MNLKQSRSQSEEIIALIDSLRPHPDAMLVNKKELRLTATICDDIALAELAHGVRDDTLFWELDGEYLIQRVSLWKEQVT